MKSTQNRPILAILGGQRLQGGSPWGTIESFYSGEAQFDYPAIEALAEMNTIARYPDPEYTFDADGKTITLMFRDRILVVTGFKDRLEARRVSADVMLAGFYAEHKPTERSMEFDATAQKYMDTPKWKETLKAHRQEQMKRRDAKIKKVRDGNGTAAEKEKRIRYIKQSFSPKPQPLYSEF